MSISPSRPTNGGFGGPQTPQKSGPPSAKSTPNPMIRNIFARNRPSPSPYNSPTRAPPYPPVNTIVLNSAKRAVNGWQSPSPEPESEGTPTPTKAPMQHTFHEVKQELKEIQASDELINVPAGQHVDSSKSSAESNGVPPVAHPPLSATLKVRREFSPTFKNLSSLEEDNPFLSSSTAVGKSSGEDGTHRPRKRVRMAIPDPADQLPPPAISSQSLLSAPPNLTASQLSLRSNPTDDSSSTVPSNLSNTAWTFHLAPPSRAQIATTMEEYGFDTATYIDPHYSNAMDVPARPKMFAGRMFTLKGNGLRELEEFEGSFGQGKGKGKSRSRQGGSRAGRCGWEYAPLPPSRKRVITWCVKEDAIEAEKGQFL